MGPEGAPCARSASLAAESGAVRDEASRLKAGCSQDWLPHKAGRLTIGRRLNNLPHKYNLPHKGVR